MDPTPTPCTHGKRPSLGDVAAMAGVAKSTASRALGNGQRVARKTQRVVQEAARKLGYQPDLLLSSLARGHWRQRADYSGVPVAYLQHRTEPYYSMPGLDLLLRDTARHAGFHLDRIEVQEYPDPRRLEAVLRARGIEGVILGSCRCPYEQVGIDWSPYAVVACDNSHFVPPFDWVLQDYAACVRQACHKVVERGYRRPALAILRDVRTEDHWQMESAFQISVQELAGIRPLPVYYGGFRDAGAYGDWIGQLKPDVVICNNSMPAFWRPDADAPAFVCITTNEDAVSGFGPVAPLVLQRALDHLETLLRRGMRGIPSIPTVLRVQVPWKEGRTLPRFRGG